MSLKDTHILLIQPLVGIGDMLWHKPWIENLSKNNKITLLAKPTTKSGTFGRTQVAIDGLNGKYVKEAFLRGLFCNTYSKISDNNICEMFLNAGKDLNEFEKTKWYRELNRRNLKCGKKV